MKLYTEFELKRAMDLFLSPIRPLKSQVIQQLTPIELPSDEEIEKQFTIGIAPQTSYPHMIEGAKWMRDKILNKGGESATVKNK